MLKRCESMTVVTDVSVNIERMATTTAAAASRLVSLATSSASLAKTTDEEKENSIGVGASKHDESHSNCQLSRRHRIEWVH
jgi:hypothetical protein